MEIQEHQEHGEAAETGSPYTFMLKTYKAVLSPSKSLWRQQKRKGMELRGLSNSYKWVVRGGGSWIGVYQGDSVSRCWRRSATRHSQGFCLWLGRGICAVFR